MLHEKSLTWDLPSLLSILNLVYFQIVNICSTYLNDLSFSVGVMIWRPGRSPGLWLAYFNRNFPAFWPAPRCDSVLLRPEGAKRDVILNDTEIVRNCTLLNLYVIHSSARPRQKSCHLAEDRKPQHMLIIWIRLAKFRYWRAVLSPHPAVLPQYFMTECFWNIFILVKLLCLGCFWIWD